MHVLDVAAIKHPAHLSMRVSLHQAAAAASMPMIWQAIISV